MTRCPGCQQLGADQTPQGTAPVIYALSGVTSASGSSRTFHATDSTPQPTTTSTAHTQQEATNVDANETPDSVLKAAHDAINGQRRTDYGKPLESFQRIADIATAGLSHKLTEPLEPEDINWLLLYALKGSRAAQGLQTGTFHRDTYIDTAGYAGCAELIHNEREGNDL